VLSMGATHRSVQRRLIAHMRIKHLSTASDEQLHPIRESKSGAILSDSRR
jgi:hypothetical protein